MALWVVGRESDVKTVRSTSRIPNTTMRFVCQNETELNSTYPAQMAVARVYFDSFKAWKYTG